MVASLLSTLRDFADSDAEGSVRDQDAIDEEVELLLDQHLKEARGHGRGDIPLMLPSLFKIRSQQPTLQGKVAAEARNRALVYRHNYVLANDQLEQILDWLKEHSEVSEQYDEERINYDGFTQVAAKCQESFGQSCNQYFKASNFLRFEHDDDGAISIYSFYAFVIKRSNMYNHRLNLSWYDGDGDGFLSRADLEDFISDMVPDMPLLADMEPGFLGPYKTIAAAKFMFFHGRRGRARIRDIVASEILDELYEMHRSTASPNNWFSLSATMEKHNLFKQLDDDMSGGLSKDEFMRVRMGTYNGVQHPTMSQLFVDRIFEEHVGKGPSSSSKGASTKDEMDLLEFLDFLLAWQHRGTLPAVRYFMSVFDYNKNGYMTQAEIYFFFQPIRTMWLEQLQMSFDVNIHDVRVEIWDMIKPKHPLRITVEDLMESTRGDLVPYMLADVEEFYAHDQKESQPPPEEEEEAE